MTNSTSRRLAAEFIGTAFLIATGVGAGIMAERLAEGNAAISLMAVAIASGAILVVLITMLIPISGGHINPVVSLIFTLKREITAARCAAYIVVQIAGGVCGVLAAHLMFGEAVFQIATTARTGGAQWFSEAVATFGLIFTVLATGRGRLSAVPTAVGLYVVAAFWFTGSASFANPALSIARAFTDTFTGIMPAHVPMFIIAQVLGATLAWAVCAWLLADGRRTEGAGAPAK